MNHNNNFKKKLDLIMIGSIVLFLSLGAAMVYTVVSIKQNVENNQRISTSLTNIIQLQSSMRGFLLNAWSDTIFVKTGTNAEVVIFNKTSEEFESNLAAMVESSGNGKQENLAQLKSNYASLKTSFTNIASLIKERGFKDLGLESKLRESVHKLEKSDLVKDKALILVLRKHEKDFFLRKDVGYIEKFNKEKAKLQEEIIALPDSPEKDELLGDLTIYGETFAKICQIESSIGLTKSSGYRGEINNAISLMQTNLNTLNKEYTQSTQRLLYTAILFVIGIFVMMLAIVLVAINKLIKPVFEPIQSIQEKANKISQGELSISFEDLEGNTVMKELIVGFENIIQKFKSTMSMVEGISNRNIKEKIVLNSSNDEVSKTLNAIIEQVTKIDEEESIRNWHNEGLAMFARILRDTQTDPAKLYDTIISELVNYVGVNQGALFLIEGEEDNDSHLAMKGCYAYNRKKYLEMRVEFGEGLTGTCWAESESILLTEVPSNYISISSGLGDARPNSVLLVPIKMNEHVVGVIEIASFGVLEKYKVKFIEVLSESIGSLIHTTKINSKTQILLQRSQEMTEELRAQEEEMRQNMEEMQATQEEMRRMADAIEIERNSLIEENTVLKTNLTNYTKEFLKAG